MAITINWATDQVITIPRADMTLIQASPEVRELDASALHFTLRDLQAATGHGGRWPDTHNHNGESTLSGITYGRQLEILPPYTVEFEAGTYGVSVVGANTNLLDVKVANNVSLLGNNSAGLVNLNAILSTLNYQGAVWLSAANGAAGSIEGVHGVPSNPVDNMADARLLLSTLGLRRIRILDGSFSLTADLGTAEIVMGAGSTLNLAGYSIDGSTVSGGKVTGTQGGTGKAVFVGSELEDVTGLRCQATSCGLAGTLELGTGKAEFYKCHSDVVGTGTPTIDFVGAGRLLGLRQYSGGLTLTNMADVSNLGSCDYVAGRLVVDASCTAGELVVRGLPNGPEDNSVGLTVIADDTSGDRIRELWQRHGLDPDNPAVHTATTLKVPADGSIIDQTTVEAPAGTVTVERQ